MKIDKSTEYDFYICDEVKDGKHFLTIRFENYEAVIGLIETSQVENIKLKYPEGHFIPIPAKRKSSGVYD